MTTSIATPSRRTLKPITVTVTFDRIGAATPEPMTMRIPGHTTANTDAMAAYLSDWINGYVGLHLPKRTLHFYVVIDIAPNGTGTVTINGGALGSATIERAA